MPAKTTKAYGRYKDQSEVLLKFAVLVSYAVPALRDEIHLVKSGKLTSLIPSDFFHKSDRSTPDDLLRIAAEYETHLAAYILLSHFSFFESFVDGLIAEILTFQGGAAEFVARIDSRLKRFLAPLSPDIAKMKRKLQDSENPGWRERYKKYSRLLDKEGFRFPGELLAAYGVRYLIQKHKNLKAYEIPEVLVEALRINLSETEIRKYHKVRELRNDIAHGEPISLTIRQSVEMNKELRQLAIKISAHVIEHFFVIEKYAS